MSIRLLSVISAFAAIAAAQTFHPYSIFATGTAVSATGPDSITVGNGSVWVSYTNGADSTGASGSSTIVQYSLAGTVRHMYSIAGSVDGLKNRAANGFGLGLTESGWQFGPDPHRSAPRHDLVASICGHFTVARLRRCSV